MSKYLEYTRYANTGATKASAPVLGTFLNRDKLALEALCEEIKLNGGTPMDTETLLYIISGTVDYLREQYALRCVRYRLFGITFEVACYGPFETADAKFDPQVNSLEVAVRLGDDIRNCLVNETPSLVTEETASTARIYRAMDIESGALGIIIGGRSFRVTGRNVFVTREGESLKLQDGRGRLFDVAYDRVESPQRVEAHLTETPAESGTCKLILTTYGGDSGEDAKLGIYERVVSFVRFEEPSPWAAVSEDGEVKIEGVEGNRIDQGVPFSVNGVKVGYNAETDRGIMGALATVAGKSIGWGCGRSDGEDTAYAPFGPDGSEASAGIPPGTYTIDLALQLAGHGEEGVLEPLVIHGVTYVVGA